MIAFDEDFHVHSTFSDGASTLAENVRVARERRLRTLCLVDHVRADTAWLPDFVRPWRRTDRCPACGYWRAWRPRCSTRPGALTSRRISTATTASTWC